RARVGLRLAPELEVAVAQPERLVDRGVRIVDVERRRLRLAQDRHGARSELDGPGWEARVLGPRQPRRDVALDGDHELAPDPARDRVGLRPLGLVDDDLGDPVPVAEVEEDQLAVVAAAMDPAREAGGLPAGA